MPTSIYGFPAVATMSAGGSGSSAHQQRSVGGSAASARSAKLEPMLGSAAGDSSSAATIGGAGYDFQEEKIPLFLMKLWKIMEDPGFGGVICWDETGFSFHIVDPYTFCRDVLPQFFKHNNLNSLIRQLNMYGFRKITPLERSGLNRAESDHEHLEFQHPYFVRGHPELLSHIKRKTGQSSRILSGVMGDVGVGGVGGVGNGSGGHDLAVAHRHLQHVLDEVRQLREKQGTVDKKIQRLTKENEAIWQEFGLMRNHHMKQQTVVNKLIQFLATMVQPTGQKRLGKRQLLAIGPEELGGHAKRFRPNSNLSNMAAETLEMLQRELRSDTPSTSDMNQQTPGGPIIADVTDELIYGNNGDRYAANHHNNTGGAGGYWYAGGGSTASRPQSVQRQSSTSSLHNGGQRQYAGSRCDSLSNSPSAFVAAVTPPATPASANHHATGAANTPSDPMLNVGATLRSPTQQPHPDHDWNSLTLHPDFQKQDFTDFLSSVDLSLDTVKDNLNLSGVGGISMDQDALNELFSLCEQESPEIPHAAHGSAPTTSGGSQQQLRLPPLSLPATTTSASSTHHQQHHPAHNGHIQGNELAVYHQAQSPYAAAISGAGGELFFGNPSPHLYSVPANDSGFEDQFGGLTGNQPSMLGGGFAPMPTSRSSPIHQLMSPSSISLFDNTAANEASIAGSSRMSTPLVVTEAEGYAVRWPSVGSTATTLHN